MRPVDPCGEAARERAQGPLEEGTPALDILIAEDDVVASKLLQRSLTAWGLRPVPFTDGLAALQALRAPDGPRLALVDWMMPGLEGPEICRRLREEKGRGDSVHVILVTSRDATSDVVEALKAGANDYVTKPFNQDELRARVMAGMRVARLQDELAGRVTELEAALAQVRELKGMLPICCYCHSIRDDKDYWQRIEDFIGERSHAEFTHGVCPTCLARAVAEV